MIVYKSHKEIDFQKWDNCIQQAVNKNMYASSWYLDLVCKNWDALILNDYEAVMPLPWNKKWGIKYIAQPLFCQQLGVFHKSEPIDVDDFINTIPKSFLFVNMNLNAHNGKSKFTYKENANYVLPITEHNLLRKGYSKSHLKNLRKAEKWSVEISKIPDSPMDFLNRKSELSKDYMTQEQLLMENNIISQALEATKGKLFSAIVNGQKCCSVFMLTDNDRIILLTSYTDPTIGRPSAAYFFLIDYILSLDKYKGRIFDFEGSNIPGVAEINSGFGAKLTTYSTIKFNFLERAFGFFSFKH